MAVGLGLRIDQSVDLLGDFRVVVFGPVSSAGVEVVEAADTGREFAKTGPDSVASPPLLVAFPSASTNSAASP